ncbi:WYL domain containing protein [uncultured Caudovirales phage]|uniref:WYL domain containing protein n=1 Tax=uncultured Caudovirales phage TaxID=2100421 RepID=A0A6J5L756_9CAUD|nr:WYL domain containing protein [uncultured Caudovirales phage]
MGTNLSLLDISYPISENWYKQATDTERKFSRDWLRDMLSAHVVTVVFNKVDGTQRKMLATLRPDKLPPLIEGKTTKTNEDVCVVWDCEAAAWRSFRFDKLQSVEITI